MFTNGNVTPALVAQNYTSKLIMAEMVTTLIKCCQVDKNPALLHTIKTAYGFDYTTPPLNFPYAKYLQIADYLAQSLYPDLPLQTALEKLGYKLTHFYFHTPTGQILKRLAAILGPQRGADTYVSNMTQKFPWSRHTIEELGSNYIRYRVQGLAGTGAMSRGSIMAALETSGAKLKRVDTTILGAEDWVLELEWY